MMRFLQLLVNKFLFLYWNSVVPFVLRASGIYVGKNCTFYGKPITSKFLDSEIRIESGSVFASSSEYTALGVARPCIFRTMRRKARIVIGKNSGLSGVTICAAMSITIGEECLIGADVMIVDNDFHPISPSGRRYSGNEEVIAAENVSIGNNVFVGARSIILKGVSVGDNSVIGAGSVVVRDVPADSIVAGNPARIVGRL